MNTACEWWPIDYNYQLVIIEEGFESPTYPIITSVSVKKFLKGVWVWHENNMLVRKEKEGGENNKRL